MEKQEARTLRVAAVQMESENGQIEANLERATGFAESAARQGAKLIVFPEFMPTGYIFTKAIWDCGEPREGPTVRWLEETSKRLGVWLGTSFLEAEGEDFFNTFVLTTPDGEEAGRVRKKTPAFAEAFFFEGEAGPHVIDTEIGLIGVGICYENQFAFIPQIMFSQSVDIILMPHSAPSITPHPLIPTKYTDMLGEFLKNLAVFYSDTLGIPAVYINKSGKWKTPVLGLPMFPQDSSFPGLSSIADSDGTLKAQLDDQEGLIVEDVTMDPARKTKVAPTPHGQWSMKMPLPMDFARVIEMAAGTWYRLSRERRRRAKEISSRG